MQPGLEVIASHLECSKRHNHEPPPSLERLKSSKMLKEEINLSQTASMEQARMQDTEGTQGLRQLKEELAHVKTATQAEVIHDMASHRVTEDRSRQIEKEILEFKAVSEGEARRKKVEDDARLLKLNKLLAAV